MTGKDLEVNFPLLAFAVSSEIPNLFHSVLRLPGLCINDDIDSIHFAKETIRNFSINSADNF